MTDREKLLDTINTVLNILGDSSDWSALGRTLPNGDRFNKSHAIGFSRAALQNAKAYLERHP